MLVVSVGCPAGVGPEVSVAAAARASRHAIVLVGDSGVIRAAARLREVSAERLVVFDGKAPPRGRIAVYDPGPTLVRADFRPGRPSKRAGRAQLAWIDAALALVRMLPTERALVTGPVSKHAVASSGARGAEGFLGHTEHLQRRVGASHSVMCFHTPRFATSLVTTHLPVSRVPRALSAAGVKHATVELAHFSRRLGERRPRIAVTSLNPHAGEGELLGTEERTAIVPGIEQARRLLGRRAVITGPVGAETAYRWAQSGAVQGVVAMMHDQATIPTKLVAFGDAVNVTLGLGLVRTSVDHGTAYDVAWRGQAEARGMLAAMRLAARLLVR